MIQKVEDTKNIDLEKVSWCEIVVKSRRKIQTSRIKIQTQIKCAFKEALTPLWKQTQLDPSMAHALFLSGKDDKDGELMNKLALINIETMKLAKKKGKFLKVLYSDFSI